MNDVPKWWAKGDWFDVCSCNIACPCEFAQPATNDHCEALLAWHVNDGEFGGVSLKDLNVVSVASFDGNAWADPTNFTMDLFIDERADETQRAALASIFTGQAGGFMANLAALAEGQQAVEYAPIDFKIAGDLTSWSVSIPGLVDGEAEALGGPTTPPGALVQTINPPGSEVGPGGPATWATATKHSVDAFGKNWAWPGQSSKHIPFDWVGP